MKIMNRIAWAAAIAVVVSLTGCNNDDDGDEQGTIIGKWKGTLVEAKISIYEESDDTFDAEVEFKDDGTLAFSDDGQESTGTWEKNGNQLTINADLNIDYLDNTETLTVKKLTDTKLELYLEKNDTFEDPDSGIQITGTLKLTLYFDKM